MSILDSLDQCGSDRLFWFTDRPSGLRAVICVDDLTLGPAAGGVRTRSYATEQDALEDVCALAQAMTRKCALAGLAAGGAKALVLEDKLTNRSAAFMRLGGFIEELGGMFRTAGDLGTTTQDLEAMATTTQYVHTDTSHLAGSVARTTLRSMEAALEVLGETGLRGKKVLVQGCGDMGEAVAKALVAAGAEVLLSDLLAERSAEVAKDLGVQAIRSEDLFQVEADVFAPCAVGGVIDDALARTLKVRTVCGAANNVLAEDEAGETLMERGIILVPDVLSSSGAVIDGIGRSVMGLSDRGDLLNEIRDTTFVILKMAQDENIPPHRVAMDVADARLARAKEKK
ncbi:MAG: Glu/Leu/Phe/Val dehydrogenase [Deltaproteobacteria bacterium]|jgi:leucine dehydrogenase|nr:Glu/Leu/Phe/Val dehydrogenase [Deltaproteobacteria bacterium]MBT6435193.1 Glu/Leu/Phe/Val dehydrogenase [Deltaproteobacteria bacterium]MBT6490445.1 Glu/Leu/Phe/Val dehydrogenase [Deltaproteobacteria bacterium]